MLIAIFILESGDLRINTRERNVTNMNNNSIIWFDKPTVNWNKDYEEVDLW